MVARLVLSPATRFAIGMQGKHDQRVLQTDRDAYPSPRASSLSLRALPGGCHQYTVEFCFAELHVPAHTMNTNRCKWCVVYQCLGCFLFWYPQKICPRFRCVSRDHPVRPHFFKRQFCFFGQRICLPNAPFSRRSVYCSFESVSTSPDPRQYEGGRFIIIVIVFRQTPVSQKNPNRLSSTQ